jgi:hypothetical protein
MSGYARAATGGLSGAATGAELGTIIPGIGNVAGAVIGGLLGAGAGGLSGDGGAGNQQQLAYDNLQQQRNTQQYAQQLNALALQRSAAGSTDAQGNQIRYDPATNQWVSTLGARPAAIQAAEDQSTLLRNTVDIPQASQNNAAQSIMASLARRGLSGAINNYNSYTPITGETERGALQDATTRANQTSQAPIIADTLRQFARSGTAAGPVLTALQRDNSTTLAREMDDNTVRAQTDAATVNNANRSALAGPISTLSAAGTPNITLPQLTGTNPAAAIAAQVNGRAVGAGTPATQGAYSAQFGGTGQNAATKLGVDVATNQNPASAILGANSSLLDIAKSFKKGQPTNPDGTDSSGNYVSNPNQLSFGGNIANQIKNFFSGTPTQASSYYGTIPKDPNYNPFTGQAFVPQDGGA